MIKKLLLTFLCVSTSAIYGISDLKKAVDMFDVEEVLKILDRDKQASTESEIIMLVKELSGQIQRANRERIIMAVLGLISGGTVGYFLGRCPDAIGGMKSFQKSLNCTMWCAFGGMAILSCFAKEYPYIKAYTLLDSLLKRIPQEEILRLKQQGLI